VLVTLADGTTAQGDVLVGADGIRSAVRGQRLPGTTVIDSGVRGLGVYGRTPLTPELREQLPSLLFNGVIIAADRGGSRLLISVHQSRQRPGDAAAAIAPDVTLEPVDDYVMISCSVARGTVIPSAAEWTAGTPAMLREAMLAAIEGWHPAVRGVRADGRWSAVRRCRVRPLGRRTASPQARSATSRGRCPTWRRRARGWPGWDAS
jgi:hypothetical protein